MAILKKKTRKAIRKSFKKVINKHGPAVAQHLATGLAAAAVTYLGTGSKKSHKQLEEVAKRIPGGKTILKVVTESIPMLKAESHHSNSNGHRTEHRTRKRSKRSRKRQTA